jgi:PEP-CTERM motif-containing protein
MKHLKQLASVVGFAAALVLGAAPASATVILTFGQNGGGNTITGTNNGAGSTTITGTDVSISITGIDALLLTPLNAFLDLSATSIGAAFSIGPNVAQEFSGTFCITSGLGCTGTNYLSATFTDAIFGTGASLTMSSAQPPGSLVFTSDVITDLGVPRGMSFSFANVSPAVHITLGSLGSFGSSVSGTMSASPPLRTPEPATLGLLGLALAGLGFVKRRRQS